MKRPSTRRLGMESLETRDLMAGNVTASVVNNNLVIRGDSQPNIVKISQVAANTFVIAGTGTTINGQASVSLTATGDMAINLGAGNDRLTMGATGEVIQLPGKLNINLSAGADRLAILRTRGTDAGISLGITGEEDADFLSLTRVMFTGTINARMGGGDDELRLSSAQVSTYFRADLGTGSDDVSLTNITTGKLAVLLGTGNDRLNFAGLNTFNDRVVLDGGEGTDRAEELSGTTYVVSVPNPLVRNFETDLLSI
jgi:hypothetical protein